ncbi:hypothetical protein V6N13_039006 [Hibiscus sabdariffa]
MEMKLQRSTTSFRRQGSSGVTWNDKFLSGDLNMMKLNNQGNRGPDVVMRRSGSDGGNGHMQRAVEAALPAFDPPSPKILFDLDFVEREDLLLASRRFYDQVAESNARETYKPTDFIQFAESEQRFRDSGALQMEEITQGVNSINLAADSHKKNRIQVSNTKKPLFFYVNLAKRYMQQHNEVELSALGMAIATVVTIAEILKNNGLAVEKKITTSTVDMKEDARGRPVQKAKIEILLGKTENFDELMAASAEERDGEAQACHLNPTLAVDDLLSSTAERESDERTVPESSGSSPYRLSDQPSIRQRNQSTQSAGSSPSTGAVGSYTEEQIKIVKQIKGKKDHYEILGLEKTCSSEDVRKAYRKLSLKVHPGKNKAPGAEEAFKSVSEAFQCLSNEESRKKYDLVGSEEPTYERKASAYGGGNGFNGFSGTEFDVDEILRYFFFGGMPPASATTQNFGHRTGARRRNHGSIGSSFMMLVQLLLSVNPNIELFAVIRAWIFTV